MESCVRKESNEIKGNHMTNIFNKILKDLEPGKIEIIPDDLKDTEISDHMSDLINWKIVQSKSDKHPECGYPMGQVLCKSLEEAEEHIKNSEFNDCFITSYKN